MDAYRYTLSFWAEHESADLSSVPARLNMPANRLWMAGQQRTSPDRKQLEGNYRSSFCSIFVAQDGADLSEGLEKAVSHLKSHKSFLEELTSNGVALHFFVGWFSDGINSRDRLDWQLLRDLAELKIGLDFDFYAPDESLREGHK